MVSSSMPNMVRGRSGRAVLVSGFFAAAVMGLAAPAGADISDVVFRIRATAAAGQGEWVARLADGGFDQDGVWRWNLEGTRELRSTSGELLATLTDGDVSIIEDPLVSIGFSVQAGAMDTVFQITSALLSFPTLNPAEGRASGQIGGTDLNGNGVTITGLHAGGTMITNRYNGMVPAGTTFADLIVGPVSDAAPFSSPSMSDQSAVGFTPIPGAVTDISMQYFFSLSAGDTATGSGTFVVLPAPGAMGVLGLAGLVAVRRRR